jgi:predicted HAD superfamily Cof-like phosphohydrolase
MAEQIILLEQQVEQLQRQRQHEYFERGPSYFQMVKKFHEKYGLEVRDSPIDFTFESPEDNAGLWILRHSLHVEEWKEFQKAWSDEDLVAFVDACADLIYVILGTMVSFGIPFDECFAEVQRSNMSKLDTNGNPIVRHDGKILKGPDFTPPDLRSIIYGTHPEAA